MEMTDTPKGRLSENIVGENRIPSRISFAFLFMDQDKVIKFLQDSQLLRNEMK
jgi:hypothetical protein